MLKKQNLRKQSGKELSVVYILFWKQPLDVFCKKGVLRNFEKFIGKRLCQRLLLNKETLARVFSFEFSEISKNTFFTENLRATGAAFCIIIATVLYHTISYVSNKVWCKTIPLLLHFNRFFSLFL